MLKVVEDRRKDADQVTKRLVAFASPVGWIGLLREKDRLLRIKIGLPNRQAVLKEFAKLEVGPSRPDPTESRWIKKLMAYLHGERPNFKEFNIKTEEMTSFQKKVVDNCRDIPYGKTISYGDLALKSGFPNAARAVGTVMRKNNFPLVVPCHRVVAANGLGGFSASNGTKTKIKLLSIEGVDVRSFGKASI